MAPRSIAFLVACLATATLVSAQAPKAPTPGPEHQRLAYFTGKWTSEGEMKESPFGPGGKFTSNDDCQWFEGKFAVVCRTEGKGPMGPMKGLGIMSYHGEEKVYTYYGLDNSGMTMTSIARGTVQGSTWTYTDESMMGGKKIKGRYTMQEVSPTSYTFKWEMQDDAGKWNTMMEGKAAKAQ
jgi:hypothetical protein